jgi:hypothetical protein
MTHRHPRPLLSIAVISAAALLFIAVPAHAQHLKLFLLGGQSNMVGQLAYSSGLPIALQSPQDDIPFYWRDSTGLTTLRPGSGNQFGPEVTFGRTVADALPAESFGLIKHASSGSDLTNQWDPNITGNVYETFRGVVANALTAMTSAGYTYEISGMLWTQGERDARVSPNTYEADLNEFIADIRTRYGTNLPFFISRLSDQQTDLPATGLAKVRTAQENVAAADPFAYLIDTDGFSFNTDELHYDALGQQQLGIAFGEAYVNSVPEPMSLAVMGLGVVMMFKRRRLS